MLGILIGVLMLQVCWQAGSRWAVFGVSLYLFGMLSSYLCSAIYHGLPARSVWKERLRRFDHAAIYWHIAGSYSPLVLTVLREEAGWGWGLFAFVWTCAAVGTVLTFRNLKEHSNLETLCYIGMGAEHCGCFPSADGKRASRSALVDSRRRNLFHHRRVVLQHEPAALHALRVPFLCARRIVLSHLGRLDCFGRLFVLIPKNR